MPSIGFGTYLINNKEIEHVIDRALNIGYRHIDTAEVYRNEQGIGTALQNSLPGLSIKREDIFITSKVFPGNPSWGREAKDYKATVKACEDSLSRLKLEFLDLYLIHAPFTSEHRLGQWEALCDLKKAGKVKSIGVSNFNNKHIEEITNSGLETPEVNQIELHPWCQKEKLVSFLNQKKYQDSGLQFISAFIKLEKYT
jgi:2,5-diketo-D-gluconate reductase A